MSENIGIPADVYDAGNPKSKDPLELEAQQEQEETEEAKEGIASSSTNPTERAIDDAPSSIPQGHRSDAITASESGDANPTQVGTNLGFFLFEVFLSRTDVRSLERLLIPVEQAIGHFSPQAIRQENYEEKINITDPLNVHFSMKLRYDISESAFVLEKDVAEWLAGLIQFQSLKPMDVVRFYRPVKPLYKSHYLIDYVKRSQQVARVPEFRRENYLFQAKITAERAMLGSLVLPTQAVRTHFPAVGIPAEPHAKERLYFTDAHTNEWIGAIAVSGSNTLSYVLTFGATFVSSYHLKADDEIRFYRPVQPLNSRHFLIEIQERGAARTNPSQSGSAENDGDGDDSGQGVGKRDGGTRQGGNKRDGGHGGGQNVRRFGWHFLCCMKKDYQARAIMAMQLGSSGDLIKEEEEKIVIKGI